MMDNSTLQKDNYSFFTNYTDDSFPSSYDELVLEEIRYPVKERVSLLSNFETCNSGKTEKIELPMFKRAKSSLNYICQSLNWIGHVIEVRDDTFTAKKARVVRICELLIEKGLNKRLKWLCNARVNLDLETMKAMKAAGCHLIIPGIESGSQQILTNIKKGTTLKLIEEYIANAKKAGLMVHACYMVGNQGETRETMEETFRLALRLNTDTAQFYPLLPFPGTEAYAWAKTNGYIKGGYADYVKEDGTINCVLELPNISAQEMVDFCDNARKRYYFRPRYIAHRLWAGLRNPDDLKRSLKAFSSMKKFLLKS